MSGREGDIAESMEPLLGLSIGVAATTMTLATNGRGFGAKRSVVAVKRGKSVDAVKSAKSADAKSVGDRRQEKSDTAKVGVRRSVMSVATKIGVQKSVMRVTIVNIALADMRPTLRRIVGKKSRPAYRAAPLIDIAFCDTGF